MLFLRAIKMGWFCLFGCELSESKVFDLLDVSCGGIYGEVSYR